MKKLLVPKKNPEPAPAWVALLAAWLGLLTLAAALTLPFLPGSRHPRQELEQRAGTYSDADRWLPVPVYGSVVTLFVGIVLLWQMRKEPRPLSDPLVAQRVQASVGIALALIAIAFIYAYAHFFIAYRSTVTMPS